MARTVGIGHQDFGQIIRNNCFYIDKTRFIKEWWENCDVVTLITRPRRFGKTLTLSMTEHFFSINYAPKIPGAYEKELFEGLDIWQDQQYHALRGTYPVISLSFASVKEKEFAAARKKICQILTNLYKDYSFLLSRKDVADEGREFFRQVTPQMDDVTASMALHQLSKYLNLYYNKRVILLLDEYDTPMQEAYSAGYWEELAHFTRNMFNSAFKTNPYLERAIMTGITRVSRESIFSDLNNLAIVTTTSEAYRDSFGFTEEEVFQALDEYGLSDKKQAVKYWYDGFIFGTQKDLYNPWSIINFLKTGRLKAYWANSSSNALISKLLWESSTGLKADFETLLCGRLIKKEIDEQIIFNQLHQKESAVWSLLLACGYLRAEACAFDENTGHECYTFALTNNEVHFMFENIFQSWFAKDEAVYNKFIQSLLAGDIEGMNWYMNKVAPATFSFYDSGNEPSANSEPERFYHGFTLGLMSELAGKYALLSNRESGLGRYDVILEPLRKDLNAIILEFKVFDPARENDLAETVNRALQQIEDKNYASGLAAKGISPDRIKKYGFAFRGKTVLIG